MKYLLVFIAIVLGLFMAKKQWRAAQDRLRKDDLPNQQPQPADAVENVPQTMVACAHCGVYLAQNLAVVHDGRSFCCAEHSQAFRPPEQRAKSGGNV